MSYEMYAWLPLDEHNNSILGVPSACVSHNKYATNEQGSDWIHSSKKQRDGAVSMLFKYFLGCRGRADKSTEL